MNMRSMHARLHFMLIHCVVPDVIFTRDVSRHLCFITRTPQLILNNIYQQWRLTVYLAFIAFFLHGFCFRETLFDRQLAKL